MTHLHNYIFWGYGILLTPPNTNIHNTYNGKVISYSLIIPVIYPTVLDASETSRLLRHPVSQIDF